MIKLAIALTCVWLALAPQPGLANCFADYKAKSSDLPLRLHYGVIAVPEAYCTNARAERFIADRIRARGWVLLRVVSLFGSGGLDDRRENAGEFYLRY